LIEHTGIDHGGVELFVTQGLLNGSVRQPADGAVRVTTVPPATNNVYYVLSDHLGSTSVVTNSCTAAVATQGYREASPKGTGGGYPYGETRYSTGTLYTDKLFTGQQQVAWIELYFIKRS
jgi:hypothetical protein